MSGARSGWIMARSPTAYHTSHRKVGAEIAELGFGFLLGLGLGAFACVFFLFLFL